MASDAVRIACGRAPDTMSAIRLAIIGDGRMGSAVADLAPQRGFEVIATIGQAGNERGQRIAAGQLAGAEVAIEFTEPAAAADNILACVRAGLPVVTGTTGWYDRLDEVRSEVRSTRGTLVWAPNFSAGVVLLTALVERAGALFPERGFDAHLVETHHGAKKDAPSGTALRLARAFADGGGTPPGITSVRLGQVPGTHDLVLDGPFEQVRLVHEARDRRVFADGALRAATWLRGRRGIFTMEHVLGLRTEAEE